MDSGSLAWVLTSAALVLFMTPGLAFFYGGMDQRRNVLNMLMMNFYCVLIIPVLWAVVGFSLASTPFDNDFIGGFDNLFLEGIGILGDDAGGAIATLAFLGMFAAITPALISGAVADRMKFSAWALFVPVWSILVYVPIFKWIYGGWLGQRGSLDFAGGTAIHVNAGIAALAAVLVIGKRKGWPEEGNPPHSMPLVMIGAGILWFGWFGFNAGSALGANGQAAQAFLNTFLAAADGRADVDRRRVDPRRSPDQPRCGIGHRRRPRGDHAGRRLRVRRRAAVDRPGRRADLLLRRQAEDEGRLRRRPRRRRRALRRRARRLAVRRPVRQPGVLRRRRSTRACSTAAGSACSASSCWPTPPPSCGRSSSPSAIMIGPEGDDRGAGVRGGRGPGPRPVRARRDRLPRRAVSARKGSP